jgi:hypothetical protein
MGLLGAEGRQNFLLQAEHLSEQREFLLLVAAADTCVDDAVEIDVTQARGSTSIHLSRSLIMRALLRWRLARRARPRASGLKPCSERLRAIISMRADAASVI